MKKFILSAVLIGLFVVPTANVFAQENERTSHWSLGIRGGGTYFRVAPSAVERMDNMSWGVGGVLEYTINPLWGFGLSVDWLNFDRPNLEGRTLDLGLFSSVNVLNLFSPNRSGWRRGGLYFNMGAGAGLYDASGSEAVNGVAPFGMVGAGIEVPLGNTFALFGDAQYRQYAPLASAGLASSSRADNDAVFVALGLRVKFGANSRQHVRNMRPVTEKDAIEALRRELRGVEDKVNTTAGNVDNLNRRVNDEVRAQQANNAAQQAQIDQLRKDLDALKNYQPVVMHNIQFQFESARLTAQSIPAIEQIARELKANQNWSKLTITGYTCNMGPDAVNNRLSLQRAEAVKNELVRLGIPANRIEVVGKGSANPIASNATLAGRQQNRRVEFQLAR